MRSGTKIRKTKETDITVKINLDGSGEHKISTGIGFFDHMLELFAVHSGFDLEVKCAGDLKVDGHHSVEDVGITLGKLINEVLGDKKGIARFASDFVPMDESLARAVIDISGRPYFSFSAPNLKGKIGDFDAELINEFFQAVANNGLFTLYIDVLQGTNTHHMAEAAFKAFAKALSKAVKIVGNKIPSSKGTLE